MGEGLKMGGGDQKIINGTIKNHIANTADIPANTFVEFVPFGINGGEPLAALSNKDGFCEIAAASGGRALVVYNNAPTLNADTYQDLKWSLVSADNNKVAILASGNILTDRLIFNNEQARLRQIGADKYVLIVQGVGFVNNAICTVEVGADNSVTFGTFLELTDSRWANCAVIADNKILVVYNGRSSETQNALYGCICTLNGTLITAGKAVELYAGLTSTGISTIYNIVLGALNNNLFAAFVAAANNTTDRLLIKVTGSTLTLVEAVKDNNDVTYGRGQSGDIALVGNNRFLVIKPITSLTTGAFLYQYSTTKIEQVAVLQISSDSMSSDSQILQTIDGDFVTSPDGKFATYWLSVAGDAITVKASAQLYSTGGQPRICRTDQRQFCAAGISAASVLNDTRTVHALPFTVDFESIKPAEKNIYGLTKTKATASKAGKVWTVKEA